MDSQPGQEPSACTAGGTKADLWHSGTTAALAALCPPAERALQGAASWHRQLPKSL